MHQQRHSISRTCQLIGLFNNEKIIDIETNLGNRILEGCLSDGWKKTSEYSHLMFDKGIDYDAYTIEKDHKLLDFEWTNWEEWEISGGEAIIGWLIEEYKLVNVQRGRGTLE